MVLDKETVIKAFDNLSRFVDTNVHPIVSPDNWNVYSQLRDMIDLIAEDVLFLLKEQEAKEQLSDAVHETAKQFRQTIVRCKDCRNAIVYDGNEVVCTHIDSNGNDRHTADWFCADGERFGNSEQL